jgi:hypothetical protein
MPPSEQDPDAAYLPERAITSDAQDRFGRASFAKRLTKAVLTHDGRRARGVVVGLVGPWGSGKSSILNLLEEELSRRKPKPVVVRFEPWLISGRDDLILALMKEMYGALKREPGTREKASKFLDAAAPYLSALGRVADIYLPGVGGTLETGAKKLRDSLEGPTGLAGLKKELGTTLETVPSPVVVLIDELDRLRDEEVRTIAQLVRAVADFQHVSYVLAYDQRRVEEALGSDGPGIVEERRERGRAYLEKLVHIPIPLPIPFIEEVRALLRAEVKAVLEENGVHTAALESNRGNELERALVEEVFDTPREVLRATGAFRVLMAMVGDEVDTVDLLAFSALHSKFPQLSDAIRARPDHFVHDFSSVRGAEAWFKLREERDEEKRWSLRFPDHKVQPSARRLVTFLFDEPNGDSSQDTSSFTLRNRRPFLITLRLGMPPGLVPRSETERFFQLSEEEAGRYLEEGFRKDQLSDLLDRLGEVYPLILDPADHFWPAAAKLYNRTRAQWVPRYDGLLGTMRNWADLATQRLRARPDDRTRFLAIADKLRDRRDLHILPFWLQRHALAFGLFGLERRHQLEEAAFLDPTSVEAWMQERAVWVRNAFCEGELFFEIRSPLVLLQLALVGIWDEACRHRLEQLIALPEGIDQLAFLLFGGNTATDSQTVASLIDLQRFTERIEQRLSELRTLGADPSLLAALERSLDGI